MDPISGIGLVASVVQLIRFSIDSAKTIREVYQRGSIGRHDDVAYTADHLANLTQSLRRSLQSSGTSSSALSRDERDLIDLSRKCEDSAQALQHELGKLQSQPRSSVLTATRKAAHAIWSRRKIQEISKRLEANQSTLEASLLHRLSQRYEVQRLRNDECFRGLDKSLQHVIESLAESRTSLATLAVQESETTRSHVTAQIHQLKQLRLDDNLYDEVTRSLFYPDIFSRQEQVDHDFDGIKHSYEWILHKPRTQTTTRRQRGPDGEPIIAWDDFANWLKSGHGLYWMNGKAGSGKSTLMNYICQNDRRIQLLKKWCDDRLLLTPTYFFWAAGSSQQKSVEGLLRSLIYQLLRGCRDLLGLFKVEPLHAWTEERLLNTLRTILEQSQYPISICMFVDGLDEIEGRYDGVIGLTKSLAEQDNVKICLSSRPLPIFEEAFKNAPSLRLQDLTSHTIRAYAEAKLSSLIRKRFIDDRRDARQAQDILDSIVERADGVFLWAVIAIRDVHDGLEGFVDLNELAQSVNSLPSQLEDLFMLMLNRIKPAYQRDAARFLQIVLHCASDSDRSFAIPLTLCVLHFIHAQRCFEDVPLECEKVATSEVVKACEGLRIQVLSHTAGLLDLMPGSGRDSALGLHVVNDPLLNTTITFLHRTARDFLCHNEQAKTFLARKGFTEPEVHLSIAKGTLSHLAQVSEEVREPRNYNHVLACKYFLNALHHISLAERHIGTVQRNLMQSLDYDLCVRKYAEAHGDILHFLPYFQNAFWINEYATSVDIIGMAAAAGMILFVCERLNIPHETRDGDPRNLAKRRELKSNCIDVATLQWSEPSWAEKWDKSSVRLLQSSDYRQTLSQYLKLDSAAEVNPQACGKWANDAFAESYLLACCTPGCLELVRILLKAGANPMVRVKWAKGDRRKIGGHDPFWHRWISFLQDLRYSYMEKTGRSGGTLLDDSDLGFGLTDTLIFDITELLLARGVDINYIAQAGNSQGYTCGLKRRDLKDGDFDLVLEATAMFTLEECLSKEPGYRNLINAIRSRIQKPLRKLVSIEPNPRLAGRIHAVDRNVPLSSEDCETLWPLIEKWEKSGHRNDFQVLESTLARIANYF